MKNLKLIPMWAWGALLALGLVIGLSLGGNNKCDGCGCEAGCCDMDDTVCAADGCACVCKGEL
jgi:hypothetical protein